MTASDWDRRIARAAELESVIPAAAEMLCFYRAVAGFQKHVFLLAPPDLTSLAAFIPEFREVVARAGRPELAGAAGRLEAFWHGEELTAPETFFARALLEPYAARRGGCPWCGSRPQVAILRPEGYGAKRSLLCALCSSEWPLPRLECAACGETEFDKLAVYSAPEFPHIRLDACESCRTYVKTIDLTKNGLAEPVVEELAAVPLDLWAAEHGFAKLQPNLLAL